MTSVGHSRSVSTPAAVGATKAVAAVPRTAPPAAPAIVTAVAAWAWVMPSGRAGSVTIRFMVSRWVRPMPMLATPYPTGSPHQCGRPRTVITMSVAPTTKKTAASVVRRR